jgi:hypothetical protein
LAALTTLAALFPMAVADCEIDLDGSIAGVHLDLVMSIVRKTDTSAMKAVFTADRERLRGGRHTNQPAWMLAGLALHPCSFRGAESAEPGIWRGG